ADPGVDRERRQRSAARARGGPVLDAAREAGVAVVARAAERVGRLAEVAEQAAPPARRGLHVRAQDLEAPERRTAEPLLRTRHVGGGAFGGDPSVRNHVAAREDAYGTGRFEAARGTRRLHLREAGRALQIAPRDAVARVAD